MSHCQLSGCFQKTDFIFLLPSFIHEDLTQWQLWWWQALSASVWKPPASHFENSVRNTVSFCTNVTCPRSRDLALIARICGCFLNFVFTNYTATPWGITATVASLYSQHSRLFTHVLGWYPHIALTANSCVIKMLPEGRGLGGSWHNL